MHPKGASGSLSIALRAPIVCPPGNGERVFIIPWEAMGCQLLPFGKKYVIIPYQLLKGKQMLQLPDRIAFAAFQQLDTRVQTLIHGVFVKELETLVLTIDRADYIEDCNDAVTGYNMMLDYFQSNNRYRKSTASMGRVTHVFTDVVN